MDFELAKQIIKILIILALIVIFFGALWNLFKGR